MIGLSLVKSVSGAIIVLFILLSYLMKFVMSVMEVFQELKVFDISIYKTYLFAFGLLLAQQISWFSEVDPLIWLAIAVVGAGYLMTFTYRSREDTKGYIDTVLANFREYSFWDAGIFEVSMVAFGLAFYQYIPWFATVDSTRYIAIVVFGVAWLTSLWAH